MNASYYTLDSGFIEEVIKLNKVMKASVLMYIGSRRELIGFNANYTDANLMKIVFDHGNILHLPEEENFSLNMVFLSNDLVTLYKADAALDNPKRCIAVRSYYIYDRNSFAAEMTAAGVIKPCFEFFPYYYKYNEVMRELTSPYVDHCADMRAVPAFDRVFTSKSSDGIIRVCYNNHPYFIYPTTLGIRKNDLVSFTSYDDHKGGYLCNVSLLRKNYQIMNLYRSLHV